MMGKRIPAVLSPDDAEDDPIWERRYQAVTLRNAGMSYTAIGERLGVDRTTAAHDVQAVLRQVTRATVEELVARQRTIVLDLQRANYPRALGGDYDAQREIMRGLDHEAKLFGLYAPARVDVGISDAEFTAQVAQLVAMLRPETVRELVRGHVIDAEVVDPTPAGCAGLTTGPDPGSPAAGVVVGDDGAEPWSNL